MKNTKVNHDPCAEVTDQEQNWVGKWTMVRLTYWHTREIVWFLTKQKKWILKSIMAQENHQHRNGSSDDLDKPNPTSPPTHLPFLCCCNVYGVHNVFHSIYYLFSSDSVLFKLGFHGWLRDTLLRGAQATTHYCNSMSTQSGISLSESTCCQFYHELKPVKREKVERN